MKNFPLAGLTGSFLNWRTPITWMSQVITCNPLLVSVSLMLPEPSANGKLMVLLFDSELKTRASSVKKLAASGCVVLPRNF